MRIFLTLAAFLFCSAVSAQGIGGNGGVGGSGGFGGGATASGSPLVGTPPSPWTGNTTGTSGSYNTTGSTILIVGLTTFGTGPCAATVTSTPSNTWACVAAYGGGSPYAGIWYAANPTTGTTQTVSISGAGFFSAFFAGFSTVVTTSPLDGTGNDAYSSSAVSSLNTGNVTTSQTNDLCIAVGADLSTGETAISFSSPSAAFTSTGASLFVSGTNVGGAMGYYVMPTIGNVSTTYTPNGAAGSIATANACFLT
jgi:hypothetical protein